MRRTAVERSQIWHSFGCNMGFGVESHLQQETLCSMAFADRASRATLGAESAQEVLQHVATNRFWTLH